LIRKICAESALENGTAELGISHRTVENHRNNISAKLDVSGSHALIKFALQNREEI
jgi:DNA-binding NarL/FixJ family response regulator